MVNVRFDSRNFNKILNNSVEYSKGFLQGIELSRLQFNRMLGGYTAEALGEYIDSKARMNPESLQHVYEWNNVGNSGARLFKINVKAGINQITFTGSFLESKSTSESSREPFPQKAEVMEEGISITVEPRNSDFLVFEDEGQTVFTNKAITITNPGGPAAAGGFAAVVDEFFDFYFTNSILNSLLNKLSYPEEFARFFPGIKGSARTIGVAAGRKYFRFPGGGL